MTGKYITTLVFLKVALRLMLGIIYNISYIKLSDPYIKQHVKLFRKIRTVSVKKRAIDFIPFGKYSNACPKCPNCLF